MILHDDSQPLQKPSQGKIELEKGERQFDLARTKFGRRRRKIEDKLSNNARVRNSYLKVIMDDAVFDHLHRTICEVGHQWENQNIATNTDASKQTTSKKQSKRQLSIKPRSRNSLHMTYFFAGKVLEDMTSEEVQRWENMVRKCVLKHNNGYSGDYSLQFKSLVTFPPRRDNLIVAVFESSSALDDLYEDLCNLAGMKKEDNDDRRDISDGDIEAVDGGTEYEFPLLRDLTQKQQKQRMQHRSPCWVAHVTLGTLVGGTKGDVERLSEWLGDVHHEGVANTKKTSDKTSMFVESSKSEGLTPNTPPVKNTAISEIGEASIFETRINALGLTMGGPVPGHVNIDWNFPFNKVLIPPSKVIGCSDGNPIILE
eukprot:CAMPEP_0181082406 /NCGR_PEP_ID=MMETSP1071-20121207/3604_1 /TAXON_ID=35127 /ORGANISM="Thalassiosira sp., Strain NH16" /LENGTH=369 /DNA_ID=CAMNT_0023163989 /DNA_START=425 /DNA_END=1534 /DNA_ORIENTATION=+